VSIAIAERFMKTKLAEEEIVKYFIRFEGMIPFFPLQGFPVHKLGEEQVNRHTPDFPVFVLVRSSQESEECVSTDKRKWCQAWVKVNYNCNWIPNRHTMLIN
jgi:hypothetical protein